MAVPTFILKSNGESTRLTYSEACKMFSPEKVESMLCDATVKSRADKVGTSEYELNSRQTLIITFSKGF